jgi:hypothetical protein
MSTVTLDLIKAEQAKLNAMIASFEAAKSVQDLFPINIGFPQLNDGEKWVGIIMSADGKKQDHLILLPGETDDINWQEATEWAASIGGQLPDRVESALLYSCMKDEFKEEAYWTCETHKSNAEWAWYQYFYNGYQNYYYKDYELRARAVRRVSVI